MDYQGIVFLWIPVYDAHPGQEWSSYVVAFFKGFDEPFRITLVTIGMKNKGRGDIEVLTREIGPK